MVNSSVVPRHYILAHYIGSMSWATAFNLIVMCKGGFTYAWFQDMMFVVRFPIVKLWYVFR